MRFIASLIALALLASCASPGPRRDRPFTKLDANPSAVVAAELSFARLAQEKGQWTAFRETVADDAVMFTPGLVNAKQWLNGKADPAASVEWQPHKIYMSCDGSMGASIGAWQAPDGSTGHFATIWQRPKFDPRQARQERLNGIGCLMTVCRVTSRWMSPISLKPKWLLVKQTHRRKLRRQVCQASWQKAHRETAPCFGLLKAARVVRAMYRLIYLMIAANMHAFINIQ